MDAERFQLPSVCFKTICRWVQKDAQSSKKRPFQGYGKYFRVKKPGKVLCRQLLSTIRYLPSLPSIEERPCTAAEYGHWECDLIHGHKRSGYILTAVERKSGFLMARFCSTRHHSKQTQTQAERRARHHQRRFGASHHPSSSRDHRRQTSNSLCFFTSSEPKPRRRPVFHAATPQRNAPRGDRERNSDRPSRGAEQGREARRAHESADRRDGAAASDGHRRRRPHQNRHQPRARDQ